MNGQPKPFEEFFKLNPVKTQPDRSVPTKKKGENKMFGSTTKKKEKRMNGSSIKRHCEFLFLPLPPPSFVFSLSLVSSISTTKNNKRREKRVVGAPKKKMEKFPKKTRKKREEKK